MTKAFTLGGRGKNYMSTSIISLPYGIQFKKFPAIKPKVSSLSANRPT
jgi:hypothetical protein